MQSGIVYCLTRNECENVAEKLEGKLADLLFPLPGGRRRVRCALERWWLCVWGGLIGRHAWKLPASLV